MHDEIIASEQFTNLMLDRLRSELATSFFDKPYVVVTGGSYARKEASKESDLDWFVIVNSESAKAEAEKDLPAIKDVVKKLVPKEPSTDGAFGKIERIDEMVQNIGGDLDLNHKITRRVLFLLEGEWLLNQQTFVAYRNKVLDRYIQDSISEHQFCRFLLNDLIRYYRTICVDFEHKTTEAGKEWGIRNIKLIFSRKLLYFSGILVTAETWQHTHDSKLQKARSLLSQTPIRRIQTVCGERADLALDAYGEFLRKLANPEMRELLKNVKDVRDDRPEAFCVFKNEGHHFSWMLAKLLKDKYDVSHPIHNALIV